MTLGRPGPDVLPIRSSARWLPVVMINCSGSDAGAFVAHEGGGRPPRIGPTAFSRIAARCCSCFGRATRLHALDVEQRRVRKPPAKLMMLLAEQFEQPADGGGLTF